MLKRGYKVLKTGNNVEERITTLKRGNNVEEMVTTFKNG
jgi:hypothetical protein